MKLTKAQEASINRNGHHISLAGHLLSLVFCRVGEVCDFYPQAIMNFEMDEFFDLLVRVVSDDDCWNWTEQSDAVLTDRISYAVMPRDTEISVYLAIVKGAQPGAVRNSIRQTIRRCLGKNYLEGDR